MKWKQAAILCICGVFCLGGIMNVGFSGPWMALPFAIGGFMVLKRIQLQRNVKMLGVICFVVISAPFWIKSKNPLYYPVLGAEFEIVDGFEEWCIWESQRDSKGNEGYPALWPFATSGIANNCVLIDRDKETRYLIENMLIGHADFGTTYKPIIRSLDSDAQFFIFEDDLIQGLSDGWIVSEDLTPDTRFQTRLTSYISALMYWPMGPLMLARVL